MKILMTFVFLLSISSASNAQSKNNENGDQPREIEIKNSKLECDSDGSKKSNEVKKVLEKSKEERTMNMKA